MLSASTAGELRTNVPGCSNACLIQFTLPYYIKPQAASNRRVCWISAVGAGGSCGKCTTLGRRHTFLGSIRRKQCSPSHASSPQRLASSWVPLRHCHSRMPRSIWRSRPSPFFSLISPYPPGLHGCFHVLVFTVQRRCVRFLNRRVWMSRRSQLLFRALYASPSGRAPADD